MQHVLPCREWIKFHLPARVLLVPVICASAVALGWGLGIAVWDINGNPRGTGAIFVIIVAILARAFGRVPALFTTAGVIPVYHLAFVMEDPLRPLHSTFAGMGLVYASIIAMAYLAAPEPIFPSLEGKTFHCWALMMPLDLTAARLFGAQRAKETLADMASEHQTYQLGWVVKDMISKGKFGPSETEFCRAIAAAAVGSLLHHDADQAYENGRVVEMNGEVSASPIGDKQSRLDKLT